MDLELQQAAQEVATLAARNAPADEAKLRQSIQDSKVGKDYQVTVGAAYAPFMEFGTKKNFQATRGFENYARQFKGKQVAGPGGNLFDAILGWVKRKKIKFTAKTKGKRKYMSPEDTAFIIARSIAKRGTAASLFIPCFCKSKKRTRRTINQYYQEGF
jgi:hypothetical protein